METAMRTSGAPKPDHGLMSEWAEWTDRRVKVDTVDVLAARRQQERNVSAFWQHMKAALVEAITTANSRIPESLRVECGNTPTGGLALTRWTNYPVAFLDVSVDAKRGLMSCLYRFAARAGEQYGELSKSWSIRSENERLILSDERGAQAPEDVVQQVVDVYLSKL